LAQEGKTTWKVEPLGTDLSSSSTSRKAERPPLLAVADAILSSPPCVEPGCLTQSSILAPNTQKVGISKYLRPSPRSFIRQDRWKMLGHGSYHFYKDFSLKLGFRCFISAMPYFCCFQTN